MIQINTSMEENKSGCKEEDMVNLVKNILENCPNLEFIGLMTIGSSITTSLRDLTQIS